MTRSSAKRRHSGFTLLEMVLVLVIVSTIIALITNYGTNRMSQYRRDRAALQMQQILSAGMAYYINQGTWPATLAALQPTYIPSNVVSPYGVAYGVSSTSSSSNFSVTLSVAQNSDALIIAGELPLATVTGTGPYIVTGQVLVPGQNLNNARSVNYAGIFANGTCVPVPTCPGTMTAAIYVAPAAVSGVNDVPTCTGSTASTCSNVPVYPVSSFTAYAVGPGATPAVCSGSSGNAAACPGETGATYWRVCLNVITEKGTVSPAGGSAQEQLVGSILAVTRCVPGGGDKPNGNGF
jgi:prepilin-type N-terminal cleavage/methylation domain-containing protein